MIIKNYFNRSVPSLLLEGPATHHPRQRVEDRYKKTGKTIDNAGQIQKR